MKESRPKMAKMGQKTFENGLKTGKLGGNYENRENR